MAGNPRPVDGMAGRVHAGSLKPGMRVMWGGRPVTITAVTPVTAGTVRLENDQGEEAVVGTAGPMVLAGQATAAAVA